jgi:membrane protein implicated in regulation of membrane protease activity
VSVLGFGPWELVLVLVFAVILVAYVMAWQFVAGRLRRNRRKRVNP